MLCVFTLGRFILRSILGVSSVSMSVVSIFVAASVLFSTGDLITSWHQWHLVYLSVVHTCGAVCLDLQMAYKKAANCHFGHAAGSHLGM